MPLNKQVTIAELKVGILVVIALVLLGALILQQSWGVHWFRETAKAITYLGDVGGLKPGNPVWLAGIEIGKVRSVTIVKPETYSGNEPIFRQISNIKKQIDGMDPKQPNYKAAGGRPGGTDPELEERSPAGRGHDGDPETLLEPAG